MDILKNPIIIGLFAGTVTYIYLTWNTNEKNKKRQKKGKKKEEVNLIIPLVVSVIVWFIAYAYFDNSLNSSVDPVEILNNNIVKTHRPLPIPIAPTASYKFVKDVISESSDPKSFSLLTGGGITVPTKLPDVLLDMY